MLLTVLNVVSVSVPLLGGTLASKRKLYIVPQRSAFALGFATKVAVAQSMLAAPFVAGQSVPSKFTLPGPSPSW